MRAPSKRPVPGSPTGGARAPGWADVEQLLDRLAETGERLPSARGEGATILSYERGRRLMLDSGLRSRWVAVDDIRACWDTFERLGRIRREDVLEPGRCSAFMVELFAHVPGVVDQAGAERWLVLPA
ncbi:MAG TPA: hypothetical protein VH760_11470 [Gaiellaceae bacterium]|jgi:hypothetical protein